MKRGKKKAAKKSGGAKRSHAKRSNPKRTRAKRSNPKRTHHRRHAKRSNPPKRRRGRARRANPGMPGFVVNAGKAVVGGFAAAGLTVGALKLSQKFPAKSKAGAVAALGGAGVVSGAILGAVGLPAAGVAATSAIGMAALATATAPAPATVNGLPGRIRGIVPEVAPSSDRVAQIRSIASKIGR